jgi:hypothetical protein
MTQTLPCLSLIVLFGLAPLVGCGANKNPYFEDDEGGIRQSGSLTTAHPDNLSLPYVAGTRVRIGVKTAGGEATAGWQIKSDNPAILSVDKISMTDNFVTADCTAASAGEALLRAFDESGSEQRAALITVGNPDRVRVLSHGRLRIGGANAAAADNAEVQEARILTSGTGVFGIVYYRGSERLYGRGIIEFTPVPELMITNQTSSGGANNEWLFIKPMTSGNFNLTLRRGGTSFVTLPVVAVSESALEGLTLVQEQPAAPSPDQQIWVLVQATDTTNRKVEGVYASFTLAGAPQIGANGNTQVTSGDLYRFNYAAGTQTALIATRGTSTTTLMIAGSKGYVTNTTYLGCSTVPPGGRDRAPVGAASLFAIGLGLCGLLVPRRRRRVAI